MLDGVLYNTTFLRLYKVTASFPRERKVVS